MELTERGKSILKAIINSYIATAEPVGSRTVTKRYDMGISPATVRNIMADLEEMGFLAQPHTSAGRVPTDRAFRFYIDTLLEVKSLPRQQEQRIINYPLPVDDFNHLMHETTKLLSGLSHYVGVVMAPKPAEAVYRQIDFIALSGRRALVVFVSESGIVHNRMIMLAEDVTQADLNRAAELLNREMKGRTLNEARARIVEMMRQEKDRYAKLLAKLMEDEGPEGVEYAGEETLFVGGLSGFFDLPDFGDIGKLKALFRAFEEKSMIIKLLDSAMDAEGVRVFIGSENPYFNMEGVSVVAARYRGGEGVVGTLGVIGPTRMPYSSVIPIVDCTARVLGRLLGEK
jgi:heat-inducible transcriptional repressor